MRRVRRAVAEGRVELRFRHRVDGLATTAGAVDGVTGTVLAAEHRAARPGELPGADRHVRAAGAGRARHVRRHRGRPRSGAGVLAGPARLPARADDLRRAGARRRADARDRREGRRAAGEPRPHVALHRGRRELGPDLGAARHPDPAGALGAVVRRPGAPAARAELPGVRHARHPCGAAGDRPRPLLVRADHEDPREGVRPVRVGAEPGPDRAQHRRRAQARPSRSRRSGARLPRPRRGLRRRGHRCRNSSRA